MSDFKKELKAYFNPLTIIMFFGNILLLLFIFLLIKCLIDFIAETDHLYKTAKIKTSVTQSVDLLQIGASQDISGSMFGNIFIVTGELNNKDVYVYYAKNKDGSISKKSIASEYTKIFLDQPEGKVNLKTVHYYLRNSKGEKYEYDDFVLPNNRKFRKFNLDEEGNSYELHIPKGSITYSSNLDLK